MTEYGAEKNQSLHWADTKKLSRHKYTERSAEAHPQALGLFSGSIQSSYEPLITAEYFRAS